MAITGRIKFFERSKTIIGDGASASTTSGQGSVDNLLSFDREHVWQSEDSSDGTYSEINIQLSKQSLINRLMIIGTNIKDISVSFNRLIANASDIDNNIVVTPIVDYQNESPVIYFEFDPVTVQMITLRISRTIVPNETKYIRQVIATREIGTFIGFPTVNSFTDSFNEVVTKSSTGAKHITKQLKIMDGFKIRFRAHPIESDIVLSNNLFDSREPFTLWPCGGGYGSDHFLFDSEGWRLEDIYNVQTRGKKPRLWYKNYYKSGVNTTLKMIEVV